MAFIVYVTPILAVFALLAYISDHLERHEAHRQRNLDRRVLREQAWRRVEDLGPFRPGPLH